MRLRGLPSLAGLDPQTVIGGLSIDGDSLLTELDGPALPHIAGDLEIRNCPRLMSLTGLTPLARVDGALRLAHLPALTELRGLEGLAEIGGTFELYASELRTLTGLDALRRIGGDLILERPAALEDLAGLEGLAEIGGILHVRAGLVETLAGLEGLSTLKGGLHLQRNPYLTSLQALAGLDRMDGDLVLYANHALPGLEGLHRVRSLGGRVNLRHLPRLRDLHGLRALERVEGDLWVFGNDSLKSLAGLQQLAAIEGELAIDRNHALHSIAALDQVQTLDGNLSITNNSSLPQSQAQALLARLRGTGYDGAAAIRGNLDVPTVVDAEAAGAETGSPGPLLISIYPNPTNAGAMIRCRLAGDAPAELVLFDLAGQRVATLLAGRYPAGAHVVTWDGRAKDGRPLASGVYLVRLSQGVAAPQGRSCWCGRGLRRRLAASERTPRGFRGSGAVVASIPLSDKWV